MVNVLVPSWGPRAKFVDDLTALEIVPGNSSLMRYIANEINNFAVSNNMKLNPGKCKGCVSVLVMKAASGSQRHVY